MIPASCETAIMPGEGTPAFEPAVKAFRDL
jgi:hypothetical protein